MKAGHSDWKKVAMKAVVWGYLRVELKVDWMVAVRDRRLAAEKAVHLAEQWAAEWAYMMVV